MLILVAVAEVEEEEVKLDRIDCLTPLIDHRTESLLLLPPLLLMLLLVCIPSVEGSLLIFEDAMLLFKVSALPSACGRHPSS